MFPRAFFCLAFAACACSSAGPYGYARTYVPLSEEEDVADGAVEFDPVMADRRSDEWAGKKLSIFGVVESLGDGAGGSGNVLLSVRGLQDRNLCLSHEDDTCRVTVTDKEFYRIHASLELDPKDDVRPGSLLRVIGKLSEKTDSKTGNNVLDVAYYRHWPAVEFVTLSQREFYRQ